MIPGLSTLGESLQSLISKNFLISGFLPTVLFVLASFWPISVIWPDYWAAIAAQLEDLGTLSNLFSFQLLALIVASYGGGTGLPTQRECLEIMGCFGKGKVNKLAEIIAGVALAGEISLGSAISSLDWVSSHEKYGRNR